MFKRSEISHSFTHFTWQLEAVCFEVDTDQQEHLSIELGGNWLKPETASQMGIPTAMKKLINAVNL